MPNIDHERKRISAVILVYGPPGAGKTSTLYALARLLPPGTHGKVQPLQQGDGRLLRLDYRPHDTDQVFGYQMTYRLVGSPGAIEVDLLRPVVGAADALLFVADSSPGALQANVKALEVLDKMVRGSGKQIADVPIVFIYNKRDLRDAVEIRTLEERLNPLGSPYVATSAVRGQGVMEALQRLTATVAVDSRSELQNAQIGVGSANAKTTPHGADYHSARSVHADGDDVTNVTSNSYSGGGVDRWDGDDDKTEVNAGEDAWDLGGDEPAPAAPPQPARAQGPQPTRGAGNAAMVSGRHQAALARPARAAAPAPAPAPQRRAPAQPVYSDSQWRTPEDLAQDVDADDRTSPYMDGEDVFQEDEAPPEEPAPRRAQPAGRPAARGPAPQPPPPQAPPGRARVGAPVGAQRARRVEPTPSPAQERSVGAYQQGGPAPTSTGTMRGLSRAPAQSPTSTATMRGLGRPDLGGTEPPEASSTMTINALGREPESWEADVERTGHTMRVVVSEMVGYVVTRIGTPRASSRRTIRLPIRATQMDTMVPQDLVLEIDLRGSEPTPTARQSPSSSDRSGQHTIAYVIAASAALIAFLVLAFILR
jgi:signal recognition particle receptor subunit beta